MLSCSHSSSLGSLLDWLAGVFVPFLGLLLAAARGYLSSKVGGISKQVSGVAEAVVASIPSRIPFRNSALSILGVPLPDFPALIPEGRFFGVADSAILGIGTTTQIARDHSMVGLTLDGAGFTSGDQEYLAGSAGLTGNGTCGTDPKKTLSASTSKAVKVKVLKNSTVPK